MHNLTNEWRLAIHGNCARRPRAKGEEGWGFCPTRRASEIYSWIGGGWARDSPPLEQRDLCVCVSRRLERSTNSPAANSPCDGRFERDRATRSTQEGRARGGLSGESRVTIVNWCGGSGVRPAGQLSACAGHSEPYVGLASFDAELHEGGNSNVPARSISGTPAPPPPRSLLRLLGRIHRT